MVVIETERLRLRQLNLNDCEFILQLLNDPDWLRFIGDRQVRSFEDANQYLTNGPIAMAEKYGHALMMVETKSGNTKIGLCGLIRRDTLPDVDLGYAYLPQFRGQGYALEAASATLNYGFKDLNLSKIVAITTQDNEASIRLLGKLGFEYEEVFNSSDDDVPLNLYGKSAPICPAFP